MTREEKELALYCLKASSDYHSEVCEGCIKYPNCDHTGQDDVTENIIKALEQEPCEDCISRQAAIDATWEEPLYTDPLNVLTEVRDRIKALPPVQPEQRWIPVSERLPEKYTYTLWCATSGQVQSDYFNGEVWENAEKYGYEVIAWMPLPQPYAESEGNK